MVQDFSLDYGRWLSSPPEGEEVVISGITGLFPESHNVSEFRDNLYNKVDMVTNNTERWDINHPEIPKRSGKIPNVDMMDPGFFGIPYSHMKMMDPMVRLILERSVEAVIDAGFNPTDLAGSKTGVFIGSSFSETESKNLREALSHALTGTTRSMISHRISYYLKLKGPSFNSDTACSSSLYALEHAYRAIRNGSCDAAIVGGVNLCLHPCTTLQFARLGVLSPEGKCKVFDDGGNGYVRSESAAVIFLQKSKDARRIYARIIHAKVNCDGFKPQSITYPSKELQTSLLQEVYNECQTKPEDLSYVEAHGTATVIGDPEEVFSINEFFCRNRTTPLLVGSVKSNVGHSEPSSGLTSVVKAIIGMETGKIPPNLHYHKPRKGVVPLEDGTMRVVTEATPFQDDRGIIGISGFGFGGGNSHAVLVWNKKQKNRKPITSPVLICASARTRLGVEKILNDAYSNKDLEQIGLYHKIFSKEIPGNLYRGYSIFTPSGESTKINRESQEKQLCLAITQFDEKDSKILEKLSNEPEFSRFTEKIFAVLAKLNISKKEVLNGGKNRKYKSSVLQIALLDFIKERGFDIENFVVSQRAFYDYFLGKTSLENLVKEILTSTQNGKPDLVVVKPNSRNINTVVLHLGSQLNANLDQLFKTYQIVDLGNPQGFVDLLQVLGRLYLEGFDFDIEKLYPKVEFPVSRGTPMISPMIDWHHKEKWNVLRYVVGEEVKRGESKMHLRGSEEPGLTLMGHVIDGRTLCPATAYLVYAWNTLAVSEGNIVTNTRVVFEDCKFHKACFLDPERVLELNLKIHRGSGKFEVLEKETLAVSGKIYFLKNDDKYQPIDNHPSKNSDEQPLSSKDFYKELNLRGYNYKGDFRQVTGVKGNFEEGTVRWKDNFITFLDNMLQMKILQQDTRLLYVPIGIQRLYIDASKHLTIVQESGEEPELPVYISKENNTISCGGIEFRNLLAGSIPKRSNFGDPVLERYEFIPNEADLQNPDSVRVNVQLILENNPNVKVKATEALDRHNPGLEPLAPFIQKSLEELPLIQAEVKLLTSKNIEDLPSQIAVSSGKLLTEVECTLAIGFRLLQDPHDLNEAFGSIRKDGFVLSREVKNFDTSKLHLKDIDILTVHKTSEETLILLRKSVKSEEFITIDVSDEDNFSWLPELREAIKADKRIIVFAQNKPNSGILGLFNCLRFESNKIQCAFINSEAPVFNPTLPFYQNQISKGLLVNVFEKSKWGSYRHLLVKGEAEVETEHSYVNFTAAGDLSSLKWFEGPIKINEYPDPKKLLYIYYSSLNFRDVVIASGRIGVDVATKDRILQQYTIGNEFVGRLSNGKKVMGLKIGGALSTLVDTTQTDCMIFDVPEGWTMEEAGTVPIIYGTVLNAFFMRNSLRPHHSILVHSGTGGIGQATINVALNYGCKVYTTVGSKEKREYLKKRFPQLTDDDIGHSRDTSFEELIYRVTNGRGVDFVVNSLAEEKLEASIRCLAKGGTFLEIGKFDLSQNNKLQLLFLEKEASFQGIMLDSLMTEVESVERKEELGKLITDSIKRGLVLPLPREVFEKNEVEKAFRFMATGNHKGKVLIKMRQEETNEKAIPKPVSVICKPRFFSKPSKSYVIIGGLGGFGLELADWLVLRGASKLVLTSRKGVQNGYQASRIKIWKSYGTTVKVATDDVTTKEGCQKILQIANELGEVDAIFNLAVVLKDGTLDNQTKDTFQTSFGPKAYATRFLDESSRKLCPKLRHFVVFSSVSCGRGNGGQSNYGMANSVMERICRKRIEDGYPALAVQWGAVGDVGIVAEMQEIAEVIEIGGTLTQPIMNCLETLDIFLTQTSPVVASMVVAEKRNLAFSGNLVDNVSNILGIKDLKTVSLHSPLSELGMDSITALEIKQRLESEYQIYLNPQEIRKVTFAKLQELQEEITAAKEEGDKKVAPLQGLDAFVRLVINEQEKIYPTVQVKTKKNQNGTPDVILFPSVEGVAVVLEPLTKNLNLSAVCVQFDYETNNSIKEIAQKSLTTVEKFIPKNKTFKIISYSFGTLVALEFASILEKKGFKGSVVCIDGAPRLFYSLLESQFDLNNTALFETGCLIHLCSMYLPVETVNKNREKILLAVNFEERLKVLEGMIPEGSEHSKEHLKNVVQAMFKRISAVKDFKFDFKLKSKVTLYKPTNAVVSGIAEDYHLSDLTENPVEVKTFEGNHLTILDNPELAEAINAVFL